MIGRRHLAFGWLALAIACAEPKRHVVAPSSAASAASAPSATNSADDPVLTCERAIRASQSMRDVVAGCSALYLLPRCRKAYEQTNEPSGYLRRTVTECALDYCPVLTARPAVCDRLIVEGDQARLDAGLVTGEISELGKHWAELNVGILVHHHGVGAAERIARASRAARVVLEQRATQVLFALCENPSREVATVLGDRVSLDAAELEAFVRLVTPPGRCGVRSEGASQEHAFERLVVSTQEGRQWIDRARVEFRYDAELDALSVEGVFALGVGPSDEERIFRTPEGVVMIGGRTRKGAFHVEIRADGLAVRVGDEAVGPGCVVGAQGVTLTSDEFAKDAALLSRCAERLKRSVPSLAKMSSATIGAAPQTEHAFVIRVIDALRTSPTGAPLFDNVSFVAPERPRN